MAPAIPYIVGALAVGTAVAEVRSNREQVKTAKRRQQISKRVAELETVRRNRLAHQANLRQRAALLASQSSEFRSDSGFQGAVGSLNTQTAANVGAANTVAAGDFAQNRAIVRRAENVGRFQAASAAFGAIASGANMVGTAIANREVAKAASGR